MIKDFFEIVGTVSDIVGVGLLILTMYYANKHFITRPPKELHSLVRQKVDIDNEDKKNGRIIIQVANISNRTTSLIFKGFSINGLEPTVITNCEFFNKENHEKYEILNPGSVTTEYVILFSDIKMLDNNKIYTVEAVFDDEEQESHTFKLL